MCHISRIICGPMVEDSAFIHKIDFVIFLLFFFSLKWHPNHISGSRVAAILLNGWILPIGGATAVKGLRSMGLLCLVLKALRLDYMNLKSLYIITSHIFLLLFLSKTL